MDRTDNTTSNTKCILVIDDEPDIREIVQVSLSLTRSWHVIATALGKEGLKLAEEKQPDAILLDQNLDDIDGYMVLAQLKQNRATFHIPVLFLTGNANLQAHDSSQDEAKLKPAGLIRKPFDPGLLASQIDSILQW